MQIPLSELHPFPNHPFKVRDDDAMHGIMESVREYGVLTPAIVRPRETGGYEIVAGHRREHASKAAGLETLPAIVRDMDNDAATILMVDSNIQRENILPSEKAEAYKMKMAALKRQAGRPPKENSGQLDRNFKGKESREIIAGQTGESARQVQRYINLTKLCPALLEMVDSKQIAFNAAVALSHLEPEEQALVAEAIDSEQTIPTLQQAQQLKKASQEGGLNHDVILSIMAVSSPAPSPIKKETTKAPEPPPAEVSKENAPSSDAETQPKQERNPHIADDILRLKDTTKECRCTPEMFLSTFAEYVSRSQREMEVFTIPFYEEVFPALLPEHMDDLRRQIDMIHAAADKFYNDVKGRNEREQ
ncbi:MAG: ParB/RepB/Spo0J family partition protein [Oscillospiraceae bacterium]|nr:ParB/RepB/Spo0J family partition protein [Oscillospiraceae bacterium]